MKKPVSVGSSCGSCGKIGNLKSASWCSARRGTRVAPSPEALLARRDSLRASLRNPSISRDSPRPSAGPHPHGSRESNRDTTHTGPRCRWERGVRGWVPSVSLRKSRDSPCCLSCCPGPSGARRHAPPRTRRLAPHETGWPVPRASSVPDRWIVSPRSLEHRGGMGEVSVRSRGPARVPKTYRCTFSYYSEATRMKENQTAFWQ